MKQKLVVSKNSKILISKRVVDAEVYSVAKRLLRRYSKAFAALAKK